MNKLLRLFIFFLVMHAGLVVGQNGGTGTVNGNSNDSMVYYFQKSLTANGLDTAAYLKAFNMFHQSEFNPYLVPQIENISKNFKQSHLQDAAGLLEQELLSKIINSDSTELAIRYCDDIIRHYDASRDPDERKNALNALFEIRIPLRIKSIPVTFDYYTSRLQVYLGIRDSEAITIAYFCLGSTYRLIGLPDMAIYDLKKATSYINKEDTVTKAPISGLGGWMNNISVLGQLYLEVGDYEAAIEYSKLAKNLRINRLKDPNVSFLNGNIALAKLMMNDLDSVKSLLDSTVQLAQRANDFPSLVRTYEIRGQYFIAINQLDSAEASLLKCMEFMKKHDVHQSSAAGFHTPGYYLAQVRLRQNRTAEAATLLEHEIIELGNGKKEILKEQKLLIEVYHQLGNNVAADSTFKNYSDLQTFLSNEDRKNRTKSFEVEAKIEEAEKTIGNLETEKRIADLTKKYLIGIAALLLIVALIIFNRFRVTRKQKAIIEREKHRSDELLLNILPAEVAEELKEKGSTKAKYFDEVTVLFTDFKGFTQLSENLSPEALVAEINECFSAFDMIIQKHGIEKIKTIGDAYMAAGGLPIANSTHPEDVVRACLEIQQFIAEHKRVKQAAGQLFFEIRIGVHTGPVVAGIVGLKKFAYDIWGDTVNTAARMESSGEVGKVNISGSTYALVRDKFKCTQRGKIEAKNKGQIDMYFVEAEA